MVAQGSSYCVGYYMYMASETYIPHLHNPAHQVTKEDAATYSVGHVVKLVVQKYSKEEREYLQKLYSKVKGQ